MKINLPPQIRDTIYQVSAFIILLAAILYSFSVDVAKYALIIGVIGYGFVVFTGKYPGKSIRGKRLYNMQVFAVLFMVASCVLMYMNMHEWVLTLLIAAILTLYSGVMLPKIYKKEQEGGE